LTIFPNINAISNDVDKILQDTQKEIATLSSDINVNADKNDEKTVNYNDVE
jgi:hypothetical protein